MSPNDDCQFRFISLTQCFWTWLIPVKEHNWFAFWMRYSVYNIFFLFFHIFSCKIERWDKIELVAKSSGESNAITVEGTIRDDYDYLQHPKTTSSVITIWCATVKCKFFISISTFYFYIFYLFKYFSLVCFHSHDE